MLLDHYNLVTHDFILGMVTVLMQLASIDGNIAVMVDGVDITSFKTSALNAI